MTIHLCTQILLELIVFSNWFWTNFFQQWDTRTLSLHLNDELMKRNVHKICTKVAWSYLNEEGSSRRRKDEVQSWFSYLERIRPCWEQKASIISRQQGLSQEFSVFHSPFPYTLSLYSMWICKMSLISPTKTFRASNILKISLFPLSWQVYIDSNGAPEDS